MTFVNISNKRKQFNMRRLEYYKLHLTEENPNTVLQNLLLLYPLNKDRLIMLEEKDYKTDENRLQVFYVYHVNEKYLLKYIEKKDE